VYYIWDVFPVLCFGWYFRVWSSYKKNLKPKNFFLKNLGFYQPCYQQQLGVNTTPGTQTQVHGLGLETVLRKGALGILGALSKDTYKDICNYFGIWPMEQQISARQNKFQLRYCASDRAVCCTISKLR